MAQGMGLPYGLQVSHFRSWVFDPTSFSLSELLTLDTRMTVIAQAMLKEGHKHFSGVEEAVMKSVEACKAISKCTRTSLGPTGE